MYMYGRYSHHVKNMESAHCTYCRRIFIYLLCRDVFSGHVTPPSEDFNRSRAFIQISSCSLNIPTRHTPHEMSKAVLAAAEKAKNKDKAGPSEGAKPRKDKVLMLSSRGVTQRMRHLMRDLEALLPHVKRGEFTE